MDSVPANRPPLPTDRPVRLVEVALASLVLGPGIVLLVFGDYPDALPATGIVGSLLFVTVVFFAPLALGVTALLTAVADEIGFGSLLAAGVALVTIYVTALAVYTLVNLPAGGGVYLGYFFSYGAGLVLSLVVLLRPMLDRLFAGVWLRPGLITRP